MEESETGLVLAAADGTIRELESTSQMPWRSCSLRTAGSTAYG